MFGMFFVRFVHVLPPLRVICTWPSFVPAQIVPASFGDSAMANTTPAYSTPMLSPVKPPENPCRLLSFKVRSGLITCQLFAVGCLMNELTADVNLCVIVRRDRQRHGPYKTIFQVSRDVATGVIRPHFDVARLP